ncbi:hypothetical protein [Williamsia herbipolensis]|uniref:Uncharacterized protein n=1 Tax=Williamsia herbipolensis TaxID=1603258 RepID=A0AAU4K0X9_9NOCA|nr:hypothetical protein [Williamsia herbipolensis]MCX6467793.1 hypothetical protein [Mycobacteriales bacterium]
MSKPDSSGSQPAVVALVLALVVGAAVSVTYALSAGSTIALPVMIVVDVAVIALVFTALFYVRARRSRS